MLIDKTIFRAYDIRGVVDVTLTVEVVTNIGRAIGTEVQEKQNQTIIVARDGRLSGPKLLKALCDGILSTGCNIIDVGSVPTPVLYFATKILGTHSGVMLTGSHNPPNENGLKMIINGETLAQGRIQQLYERIQTQNFKQSREQGQIQTMPILPQYCDRILSDVKLSRPLKVVMDCGNGIAGVVAPELYQQQGCDVIPLFCDVDGHFPNHGADPSVAKNLVDLQKAVQAHQADIGVAFDGDADRLGVVTDEGEIILPDRVLMLLAIDVLSRQPQAKVIFDVKCTRNLGEIIKEHQGIPIMCATGHSLVKKAMIENEAALAGEMSGHLFFKERWYGFDDGIYAGARLLEILSKQSQKASEVFHALPNSINTPELKLPMSDQEKFIFMDRLVKEAEFKDAEVITIDGIRVEFKDGWGLVRPSNTTPALILRFEANDEAALKRIQEIFRKELLKLNPRLLLPF